MIYSHDGSPLQEYACGPDTSTSAYDQENSTKNVQPGLRPGRRARVTRLVGVSGAATATFTYDGDGNRVKATIGGATTTYIGNYFGWTGLTSTMNVRPRYYYAGATRIAMRTGSSTINYLLGDHLGSTAITTNSSGVRTAEVRYYPWGTDRYTYSTTPTTYRFTGQRNESYINLYWYSSRWYDAQLGRWIQPDSIIPPGQGVQAFDRYAYVNNSPINYIDTSGHWLETLWDIGSVIVDVVDIAQNGLNWENGAALVIDVASVLLPAVPAVGTVIVKAGRAANTIDNAVDATKAVDDIIDAGNVLDSASDLSHADDVVEATGQVHHIFSNKVIDALDKHNTLKGVFGREDFIVQAMDEASHNGDQAWHRAYDGEIVEWLTAHNKATPEEFLNYMLDLYKQTNMQEKFPDAYKLIEMGLEEMK